MSGGHGGRRNGSGRPKGRVSQETADIKAMVIGALHAVGGTDYLAARAIDTPTAFMALLGKVLPLQLTGEAGGPIHFSFEWAPAASVDTPAVATDAALEVEWDQVSDC